MRNSSVCRDYEYTVQAATYILFIFTLIIVDVCVALCDPLTDLL
jgi:hypothetical protein